MLVPPLASNRPKEDQCHSHPHQPHEKIASMTDQPAKPTPARKTGLSPKEQKLQALREKMAAQSGTGAKPSATASTGGFKAKSSFTGKKTAFQRKAT
jgi:hypothetical protein